MLTTLVSKLRAKASISLLMTDPAADAAIRASMVMLMLPLKLKTLLRSRVCSALAVPGTESTRCCLDASDLLSLIPIGDSDSLEIRQYFLPRDPYSGRAWCIEARRV